GRGIKQGGAGFYASTEPVTTSVPLIYRMLSLLSLWIGQKLMNMDRAIFDLKVSVEAASLYILLCALMDGGQAPTLENALQKWTGTEESLLTAAQELIGRCVIT